MNVGNWYIYEIKNLVNGKTYIGQRKTPKGKTPETDYYYYGSGHYLKNAFNKYGLRNFQKRIIIKNIPFKVEIDRLEIYYIGLYKQYGMAEYNISLGGQGGNLGEAVNKKISEKLTDRKISKEKRQKISETLKNKCHDNVKTLFIRNAKKVHGDKYDYSAIENYQNLFTKVKIICPIHGMFEQIAMNHLQGHACPQCSYDKIAIKKSFTTDNFIEKARKVHGDRYDYSMVNYKNMKTNITIICKKHGVFSQVPEIHLKGANCKKCYLEER